MNSALITWSEDYEATLRLAARTTKLVVVHFWDRARPLSRTMNDETFMAPEVVSLSRAQFLNVRLESTGRPDLFERTIGGRGALATCIVDGTEDVVAALPGFVPPDQYLSFLRGALEGYPRLDAARRAVKRRPRGAEEALALAETYRALGSARRAEETFAAILNRRERLAGAPEALGRAVALAHERLARSFVMKGRNQDARRHLAEHGRLDPGDRYGSRARLLFTEALVAAAERRLGDALRLVEEAMARESKNEDSAHRLFALGSLQHETRDDAAAIATLARLTKEFPSSPWARLAEERMVHVKNPSHDH